MSEDLVKIKRIVNTNTLKEEANYYSICLLNSSIIAIEVDGVTNLEAANSIYFLNPENNYKIVKKNNNPDYGGYILLIDKEVLNNPLLSKLHINEVRLFADKDIPKINLSPGIEKRVLHILEMIDELIGSHLKHKEDGIISLINTLFVYCDGQCNIRSVINESSNKKAIVFNYKKLIDTHYKEHHEVEYYANKLNVSSKYLNECVKDTLNTNAKSLINETRLMHARHELKFTDKTIKEISFELGFSSADYFSYFFKQYTGTSPSHLRNH